MADHAIPIKPGTFKCPDDFESICLSNDDVLQPDDDNMELVLIRAPYDIDFSFLNDRLFPHNGREEFEIETEKGKRTYLLNSKQAQSNSELGNLSVLVGNNEKYVPISKMFTHHMEISKTINVPEITFPEKTDKSLKMPSDLKQRYRSFGSDDPVVSVGEKQVLKYKKKLKKESLSLEISKTKPRKEARERRKQLEDKMELTSKYIEQLSAIPAQDVLKSLKKEKKLKVEEPNIKTKQSKSHSSKSDILGDEFKRPLKVGKKGKKIKDPSIKNTSKKLLDDETEIERSREELIKLIMEDKPQKKGKLSKLKMETSMLTYSQEF